MSEAEKARVRLDLGKDERDALRVIAARCGLSMSAYAAAAVREAIRKDRQFKREPRS